jgi:hypothetical protein
MAGGIKSLAPVRARPVGWLFARVREKNHRGLYREITDGGIDRVNRQGGV